MVRMEEKMISVIIPVYNVEKYLRNCVESVCYQTMKDLEIILVDDGSTDRSGEMCDEFAMQDNRIVVIHKENGGLVSARQAGLNVASGDFIGWVDSDDWIDHTMYEDMLAVCVQEQADVVTTSARYISRENSEYKDISFVPAGVYKKETQTIDIIIRNLIYSEDYRESGMISAIWNKLFRKDFLCKYLFSVDKRTQYGEDEVCVYPCLINANTIVVLDAAYYHYRQRDGSICHSTDEQYFVGITLFYEQLKAAFHTHPEKKVLMDQLNRYMLERVFRGINISFGFGFGMVAPRYLPPYNLLRKNNLKKIVLYGAGEVGQGHYRQFQLTQMVEIVGWIDHQWEKYRAIGLPTESIAVLKELEYDGILIAVENERVSKEIEKELREFGISPEKIFYERPRKLIQTV